MPKNDVETPTFQDIGVRLMQVRRVLGLSQVEIAARLHMKNTRWGNWEIGVSQIPPAEALKLKRMLPGLTTDWIYEGDASKLTVELLEQLTAALNSGEPVKKRGRHAQQT